MSADTSTQLEVQGTQPDNFTMLPNMAIIDLSANAYKLLAIYLDTAKTNQVYAKNSTLSKKLGVTINTMKKARKELADKGYIIFATGKDGADTTTARVVIQINWMWSENHKRMSKSDTPTIKSESDTVSNSDTTLSNIDTMLSNSDTNNQELNNQELNNQSISAPQELDLEVTKRLGQIVGMTGDVFDFVKARYGDYPKQKWIDALDSIIEQQKKQKIRSIKNYLLTILDTDSEKENYIANIAAEAKQRTDNAHNKALREMQEQQARIEALKRERLEKPLGETA